MENAVLVKTLLGELEKYKNRKINTCPKEIKIRIVNTFKLVEDLV